MDARTQAAGPPAAPTARMAVAVAAGAFRNTTGNATTAEIVNAATAATATIVATAVGDAAAAEIVNVVNPVTAAAAEIVNVVNPATATIVATAVGGDATEINEITGCADGAATAQRWRPWDVLTGDVTPATAATAATAEIVNVVNPVTAAAAEIVNVVNPATATIVATAVGGDATEINEITGCADGAATADINARPTWQPEPGSLSLAA